MTSSASPQSKDLLADASNSEVEPAALSQTLRRTILITSRLLRRFRANDDLSDARLALLARIMQQGASTPSSLAELEHVQPPSMTRMLKGLEAEGLVKRTFDPLDGRQVLIEIAPAGEQIILETRALRTRWLSSKLATLPPEDLEVLAKACAILQRDIIGQHPEAYPYAPTTQSEPQS